MTQSSYKNFTIHQFETLESTNKTAFELTDLRKISDFEIILAKSQTAGKGRKQRVWSSLNGNLYFSLVLKPKISANKIPQISFVAAVSLKLALEKLVKNVAVKWPNDLLIEEKKCAGILLESKFNQNNCEFVILGIGVNIDSNPSNTIFPATNLKNFSIEISALKMLEKFLDEFEKIYQNYLDFDFAGIRKLWLKNAYKLGEKITIKIDEKEIDGIFENIDEDANLLIRKDDEIIKISVGDVS